MSDAACTCCQHVSCCARLAFGSQGITLDNSSSDIPCYPRPTHAQLRQVTLLTLKRRHILLLICIKVIHGTLSLIIIKFNDHNYFFTRIKWKCIHETLFTLKVGTFWKEYFTGATLWPSNNTCVRNNNDYFLQHFLILSSLAKEFQALMLIAYSLHLAGDYQIYMT